MKKILSFICLLWVYYNVAAQNNLVRYEYWFDNDYSAKVSTQIATPTSTFQWQTTIPCNSLSKGLHTFNARFKDDAGNWSAPVSQYFYRNADLQDHKIVAFEYWMDNDYTKRINQPVSATDTYVLSEIMNAKSLSKGLHTFNVRFKDNAGNWSAPVSQYFYRNADLQEHKIVGFEYWMDNDYAKRISQPVSATDTYTLSEIIDAQSLSTGLHVFNIRFKDNAGNWSAPVSQYFFRNKDREDRKLVAYEYWINDNYEHKYSAAIYNQQSFTLLDSINYASADRATNTVSFRFKDSTGLWSSVVSQTFYQPITLVANLNYTRSVPEGRISEQENYYSDYADILYDVYNITQKKEVYVELSYPYIGLDTLVKTGDMISVKAVSRANKFNAVSDTIILSDELQQPVNFDILQYGYIEARYTESENTDNVGIIYDSNGYFVKKYTYSGQSLTSAELPDGNYLFISMASNELYNTIQHLSAFAANGLIENENYNSQAVSVKSGIISEVNIPTIPFFDAEAMLYTGGNTSFTVNKTQIAIGNYVTLRGEIGFADEYSNQVSEVKLIVDIPSSCSFVDNSVMIGNAVYTGYSIRNNQLIVPLSESLEAVRFCIIPSESGNYSPNAFVEFIIDGETKRQPIGTAAFAAEGLSIIVPSVTAQETIPVRGVSTPRSFIKIYDNGELIGETIALANGTWTKLCPLYKPYALSTHSIHAEINTPIGLSMETEIKDVTHNVTAIEISKVSMYNTAHTSSSLDLYEYVTVFDFLSPAEKGGIYWYWPNYPDFTFTIEFTINDPELVTDVELNVLLSNGEVVILPTAFDDDKQIWVATGKFPNSHALPINVDVEYQRKPVELIMENDTVDELFNEVINDVEITNERNILNKEDHIRNILYIDNDTYYIDYCILSSDNKNDLRETIKDYGFSEDDDGRLFIKNNSLIIITDKNNTIRVLSLIEQGENAILDRIMSYAERANLVKGWFSGWFASKSSRQIKTETRINELCSCGNLDDYLKEVTLCPDIQTSIRGKLRIQYALLGVLPPLLVYQTTDEIKGMLTNPDIIEDLDDIIEGYPEKTKSAIREIIRLESIVYGTKNPCNDSDFPHLPADFVLDPSGFVYETVTSNRLQGVTAGVYQKTWEEDMYGDLHEKINLWRAEEYAQANPVLTNTYGEYAWDVPEGEWQVKFEKEGYETTYSDWLPVPPPQLNINIPMRQATPPYVNEARGYESGIEINFNKFMIPATISSEFISATRNSENASGTVVFLNEESDPYNPDETFVSKIRFVPDMPFTTDDEVVLTVKKDVKSYADVGMTTDFVQQISIQKDIHSMLVTPNLEIEMNKKGNIEISVAPKEASVGKKIIARSVSSIAGVASEVILDQEGKANLQVTGELPGSTQIVVGLEGTNLKESVIISVTMPSGANEKVEAPTASIPSGTTVSKDTEVSLSSATPDAVIYYSYDNTPESIWLEYNQAIRIAEDISIYAIAKKTSMMDSDIVVFNYLVDEVKINPLEDIGVIAYSQDGFLYIKGLSEGDNYTIYSSLGYIITQGIALDASEEVIPIRNKGAYIVAVPKGRIKVLVK